VLSQWERKAIGERVMHSGTSAAKESVSENIEFGYRLSADGT
jgi:hypothetical protein